MDMDEKIREAEFQAREDLIILDSLSKSQYSLKGFCERYDATESKNQPTLKKGHYVSLDTNNYKHILQNHES